MTAPAPQKRWLVDKLPVELYASNDELGQAAANKAQQILKKAINQKGFANLIFGNGEFSINFF